MLALLAAAMLFPNPSNVLRDYVAKPQPDFRYSVKSRRVEGNCRITEMSFVSQRWQGHDWKHSIVLMQPASTGRQVRDCILVVTGDRVDRVDLPFAKKLYEASHLPVATLFDVPNQPLFGRREDDLIAYSFEQYLETGETNWPLLLPMANSVIRAMDAIARETGAIDRFFITGESKRGWTTWLSAATGDPRILAIAPVSYDNLDVAAQLEHQMKSWGHLSEMLASYSGPGLTEEAKTEGGQNLIRIVDPYSYLDEIHIPVLVVRGSNDPYWTADATALYWDKIRSPKELLVVPNAGHDFQNNRTYIGTLASFFAHVSESKLRPCEIKSNGDDIEVSCKMPLKEVRLWHAASISRDFRSSQWTATRVRNPNKVGTRLKIDLRPKKDLFSAYFAEVVEPDGSAQSSEIVVLKPGR